MLGEIQREETEQLKKDNGERKYSTHWKKQWKKSLIMNRKPFNNELQKNK